MAVMIKPYKNIIFDVGNVLLTWRPEVILRQTFGASENLELYFAKTFASEVWLNFDKGVYSQVELCEILSEKLALPLAEINRLMQVTLDSLLPIEASMALLEQCYLSGIHLYALTNMPIEMFVFLKEKYNFWEKFRNVTVSGYIKMIKPDPAIYHHTLTINQLDPAETLFLDDSLPNVEAAKLLGISAIHFKNAEDCMKQMKKLVESKQLETL